MRIKADHLDDALGALLRKLLRDGTRTRSNAGAAREFTGVLIEFSNPRGRFSRTEGRGTLFSCLGETLWYLSGSDRLDHISYYIPNYRDFIRASKRAVRAPGAYGPRLVKGGPDSRLGKIIDMLKRKNGVSDTRQAVLQIFSHSDLRHNNKDVPCTTAIQFLPRNGSLHMITTMRSNDAYRGFPHDVFAFTFLHELVARTLNARLGRYIHFVGSMHLYDDDEHRARRYLAEGFQEPINMPPMPEGDPWRSVDWLLDAEQAIRLRQMEPQPEAIDPYWLDLARLLRIKRLSDQGDLRSLIREKKDMSCPEYDAFIRGRQRAVERRTGDQDELPGL
ncbi:thymidylate synthase [Hansschlegelia beijingensis]|uniref:thymidylate synthase n=1 Tax=Hansschlegelia beijingensis TaxID=1133344 RepID=UPI00387F1D07